MRIFVASAAEHLTDHLPNGEGLIADGVLRGLTERGHSVTACAKRSTFRVQPTYRLFHPILASRLESLEPLRYAAFIRRALHASGGASAYDLAWWLFPQGSENMCEWLPRRLPLVIGPIALFWPDASRSPLRAGDVLRAMVRPQLQQRHRRSVRRAHAMLAVPHAVDVLPVRPRQSVVVPFAVDHIGFPASSPSADPVVAFVGRLSAAKGVHDLIEAFPAVLRAHPRAQLLIAGEGPLRTVLLQRASDLGLEDAVTFLGAVDHALVPSLLERCAMVAAPSDGEPYGMTVLEAMSAGRALIVANNGGPPFLINGDAGGRVVRPHDVGALAGAMIELLGDRALLTRLGQENRKRVETVFSWHVVLDKLEAVLRAAAAQR